MAAMRLMGAGAIERAARQAGRQSNPAPAHLERAENLSP